MYIVLCFYLYSHDQQLGHLTKVFHCTTSCSVLFLTQYFICDCLTNRFTESCNFWNNYAMLCITLLTYLAKKSILLPFDPSTQKSIKLTWSSDYLCIFHYLPVWNIPSRKTWIKPCLFTINIPNNITFIHVTSKIHVAWFSQLLSSFFQMGTTSGWV